VHKNRSIAGSCVCVLVSTNEEVFSFWLRVRISALSIAELRRGVSSRNGRLASPPQFLKCVQARWRVQLRVQWPMVSDSLSATISFCASFSAKRKVHLLAKICPLSMRSCVLVCYFLVGISWSLDQMLIWCKAGMTGMTIWKGRHQREKQTWKTCGMHKTSAVAFLLHRSCSSYVVCSKSHFKAVQ